VVERSFIAFTDLDDDALDEIYALIGACDLFVLLKSPLPAVSPVTAKRAPDKRARALAACCTGRRLQSSL
jgi:hypothetical protein